MENSSKALLIVASVLIVIILISIGLRIFNSSANVKNDVDSSSEIMAASVFNSQFTAHMSGQSKTTSGKEARTLLTKIMANNERVGPSTTFSAEKHQIYVNFYDSSGNHLILPGTTARGHNWTTENLSAIYNAISTTQNYYTYITPGCSMRYGYYKGYIICISIKEAN